MSKITKNKTDSDSDLGSDKLNDKLNVVLRQNQLLMKEVHQLNKKVSRYILMSQIGVLVKILLILTPLVVAFIYLPPLIKNYLGTYQSLSPIKNVGETLNLLR